MTGTMTLEVVYDLLKKMTMAPGPASSASWPKKRDEDPGTLYLIADDHLKESSRIDVVGYDGRLKGTKSAAYSWIGL